MPHTINGIGTWYYGKRDIHRLKGSCEFCNRVGDLASYDTTLYFVVLFVPVIPLQKYRVMEECPSCQKHRTLTSKKWKELKSQAISEVMEPLQQNPANRDAILAGLGTATQFQDAEILQQLVPYAEKLSGDADVQLQLAIAHGYFSQREEATEAYKKSLLAEDRPQTRQLMATNLLRQGQPEEAEPLIRHILEQRLHDKLYLPFLLVETYQSQGKHQEALAMLDEMAAAFPDLANDRDFKKSHAESTKHQSTGKRLKKVTLVDSNRTGVEKGSNWSRWVPALLALGLLTWYLGTAFWMGSNCKVYLLNGGSMPYQVRINGDTHTVTPGQPKEIHVPEGDVTVETVDPLLGFSPVKCKVETNFFTRAFTHPVFVVNPDATAVLVQDKCFYAAKNPPAAPPATILPMQPFHQVDPPDYLFTSFPQTISVKGSQTVSKTRLSLHTWSSIQQLLDYLEEQVPDQAQRIDRVKRLAQLDPQQSVIIFWLKQHLKPEEMLAFVKTRLDQSPLLIDWHRAYQDLLLDENKLDELKTTYAARLKNAQAADELNAKYLYGRLLDEPESTALIKESASGENGPLFALYAMGSRALQLGRFDEAESWARKMLDRNRRHVITQKMVRDAFQANKKYEELSNFISEPVSEGEQLTQWLELYRLALLRRNASLADTLKQQILGLIRREAADQEKLFESLLQASAATIAGDEKAFLAATKETSQSGHFAIHILTNDLSEAEQTLGDPNEMQEHHLLKASLCYLLAKQQKKEAVMNHCWEIIVADLMKQTRTLKGFQAMIEGKKPMTFEAASAALFDSDAKRGVFLVFADRYSSHSAAFKALASKLNYQHDAYSLAVKKLLK